MTGWRFWVLLGAGLFLVAVVAVVLPPLFVPDDITGKDAADLENDVRGTLLQGLLGFAFLAAAVGTWRQVQIASEQVQIAERGQITERFKNAIDQIGNEDSPDVRLGGIYSTEQIAKDNPETYHDLMIEILSAYVRRRSPAVEENSEKQEPDGLRRPPVDIQATLTVLGRRKPRFRELDIDLTEANLAEATLTWADLTGARLTNANLAKANLAGADLTRADLAGADLTEADLTEADLTEANLTNADLTNATLTKAHLTKAHVTWATLTWATLTKATLATADLTEADLTGADLAGADLTEADLTEADLTEADLTEADLTEADLTRADLTRADLTRADLTRADLANVRYDDHTTWPAGFQPRPPR